jgi:bifunctional UDP-N-acetylglucosamine pyrophosphorylase/glucosamine-1-phosphate N-acetyltransferase
VTSPAPKTKAVILAAGLGTRMKSRTPKVLHQICGRPMLAYVIDAAREATGERPIVVYSPPTEEITRAFAGDADFALQPEPRGTGDALAAALAALPADIEEVVVMSGDAPLVSGATVASLLDTHRGNANGNGAGAAMTLTAMRLEQPRGYGRIVRSSGDGTVERIVEEKEATDSERTIAEVNAGMYAFDAAWLRTATDRLRPSAVTGEIYLVDLVTLAHEDQRHVAAHSGDNSQELSGINDRLQMAEAERELNRQIIERHLLAGVTIQDPWASVYIDSTVEIEPDVTIEPNVVLRGKSRIGRDTVVKTGSQIIDSTVGEHCVIWASVIESSEIGNDVRIGPFAHLRAGCVVGDGAEIGNYAEQKNTRFGARSKQHHFSYLGDAEVGEDVNIGAGTITANYDGRQKHKTIIGNGAFIGSDTILRAPLTVGDGAYTGAGSVVTRDVPPGKLAVGVPARIRERRARPDDPEMRER